MKTADDLLIIRGIEPETRQKIQEYAKQHKLTMSQAVAQLLTFALDLLR